jgi:hypothetical protein
LDELHENAGAFIDTVTLARAAIAVSSPEVLGSGTPADPIRMSTCSSSMSFRALRAAIEGSDAWSS